MTRLTVEPMLRLTGGLVVAVSVLLGIYVSPYLFWFTLFVGLNLAQSGLTGWCPMVWFLKKCHVPEQMPRVKFGA